MPNTLCSLRLTYVRVTWYGRSIAHRTLFVKWNKQFFQKILISSVYSTLQPFSCVSESNLLTGIFIKFAMSYILSIGG